MGTITLKNGKSFDTDMCLPISTDALTITVFGKTMNQAVTLLNSSKNTEEFIYASDNGHTETFRGYVELSFLLREGDHLRIELRKGVTA